MDRLPSEQPQETEDEGDMELTEEEFLQLRHQFAMLSKDKTALEKIADEMNKDVDRKQELIMDLRLRNATLTKTIKGIQQDASAQDTVIAALHAEIDALKRQLSRRVSSRPIRTYEDDDTQAVTSPDTTVVITKHIIHEVAGEAVSAMRPATQVDVAPPQETIAEDYKSEFQRAKHALSLEREARISAQDALEEAVSRVRELEREAAEFSADCGVPMTLSLDQELPEDRGLTCREQRALFARVLQLV